MDASAAMEPGFLSVVPALVAIALAFWTKNVLPALFAGIVTAGLVMFAQSGEAKDLNVISKLLLPALGSEGYAKILLIYLWSLGGLIGIWEKTGAALHFAEVVGGKLVKGPRSAMVYVWVLGCVFHQGGTVSTVLAGTTARPVADKHKISHEELSYIVDSTASPVATVIPFNAWPTYVAGLIVGAVPFLTDSGAGVTLFFQSIPFNFYGIFAVFGTLLFALGWMPWVGKDMAAARTRARSTGALDAPGARPMMPSAADLSAVTSTVKGYTPSLLDFGVPLGVLIGLAVIPIALSKAGLISNGNWINEAFLACVLSAMVVAVARGMKLDDVMDGFLGGCKSMTIGALILGLAVTMGEAAKALHTSAYLVGLFGDALPAVALPAVLTLICMGISFATGTSFGTYAVVMPVALPMAWHLVPDPTYLKVCFGAVIGGAVYGDQCSPVSDTTILSSMFSGCDLMDHTRTQLPLATVFAGLGAVASTIAAALVLA